ncbi:MAG: hypothetical protein F6K42_02965 [Leptolyngbya sp. SIO1D8]|nr:hypothetical protein [Leptolyngbya sp. SIO1D8]
MSNRQPLSQKRYLDSEAYRSMLVQDGERRFREWHTAFLSYQKAFLDDMAQQRQKRTLNKF